MTEAKSAAKRQPIKKGGRVGNEARKGHDVKIRTSNAHANVDKAIVASATTTSVDAKPNMAIPQEKPGITTDSFNNLLSNFTQALSASNVQTNAGNGSQEQLLCEMGKLFLSSMMTFNQILQNHASSTATAAVNTVPENVAEPTDVPSTSTGKSTVNKDKVARGGGTSKTKHRSAAKEGATNSIPPRDTKGGRGKAASKGTENNHIIVADDDVVETSPAPTNRRQAKKNETEGQKGNASREKSSGSMVLPKSVPSKKRDDVTTPGDINSQWILGKHDKVSGKKDDLTVKTLLPDAATAVKIVGKHATRATDINQHPVLVTQREDTNSDRSPTDATHSELGSTTDANSVKPDFSTATTPNNVLEAEEMAYLGGLASAEEQLNFSIYRFVDSCTNVSINDGNEVASVDKLGEWLGTHSERIERIADKRAPAEIADDVPHSPGVVLGSPIELLRAAFMGDLELLKSQKNVDVNHVDEVGRSALHYASAAGAEKCVEYLLASGVNVNLADKKGWTAIHIAVSKNYADVARVLIDGGADIFALLKHKCAPARLMDVYSPAIHFAAIKGNIEITELLLAQGATVNDVDSANMTPLHYAAFRPNTDYVRFLLEKGAVVDVRDVNGRSPFHASALSGMVENARLMVEKHPFLNEEDVWSLTPYKLAELRNHSDFCKYLKETLHIFEEDVDDINRVLASTIAVALQEPNADQIYRCVTRIGPELSKTVFDLTMQIERNGGVLTADGSRKRTSGGIFFTCLRELYLNDIISKDDYNYIRAAENEKRIAKAKERRNKLKALFTHAVCDVSEYESRYVTRLQSLPADERYEEPLRRLAFGSCQKLDFGDNRIFPVINEHSPDLFLYTGDIVYPKYGCCTPNCIQLEYDYVKSHPVYKSFVSQLRRLDGVYDDHDFGINDGHDNYPYKRESQQLLLDFLDKPKDHYRRKREGAYFSAEYVDPANPKHRVKVIVLDVRYHRGCFYYCTCQRCSWKNLYMYNFFFRRLVNYYLGLGCNHPGDVLGEEQWKWLEGQLHESSAESHVIVSSMQVFTRYPIAESWGLLPEAKDRLVNLLLATKPKNTIFVSGDVHWGELIDGDGIIELTASSLTHSFLLEYPSLKLFMSVVASWWDKLTYGYNNFGIIDFEVDDKNGNLTQDVKLLDEMGKVVFRHFNDGTSDPLEPYRDVEHKPSTLLNDTRIVKCMKTKTKGVILLMAFYLFGVFLSVLMARAALALTAYEKEYRTQLRSLPPDEIVEETLSKLAFGSCQKLDLNPSHIFNSIKRYAPDMFLYTGDIVYAPNGCCEPHCLKTQYDAMKRSPVYQGFASSIKHIDGIYDDHDFGMLKYIVVIIHSGVNDGHSTYEYRDYSQKYLLDFFDKPADHYRRKRKGAYFSLLFEDPSQPKRRVKLIVLDVRYHRECYYYCVCGICKWAKVHTNRFIFMRSMNFLFGFGCNHPADTLGEEQWKWLEGQLHKSTAEAHVIVSSMQIFTRYPITESWGLLPVAKDRLVQLLMATKPKNPIFISGDVHYGEVDVKDGVVEITSSSLTHSFLEGAKSRYRPLAMTIYFTKPTAYMFNNFGGLEFEYDAKHDALKWSAKLFDVNGKFVDGFSNDVTRDPREPYRNIDAKKDTFFKNTRIVKCRGPLWRITLGYIILCLLSWMVLIPYVALSALYRALFFSRKEKQI
ncbi:26S proteasome non-ATPase regulatory subunit 10 [Babesia sp. Xinjiang]|uniref:26S proteasome non-ATPase regulatory subunit 10 n=1 Tax=Babesia sp. Xinjiang TaxID=462227 RepID=UPI000A25C463|nr:26S proteasome non-ATPase regulatory subunit 10 [Babesia sp. Xinjiang]XP_028871593.1 26S proteasome non-ATPase regulatory subunit 10 [Babesia sp. Xinjiang]ORM41091.1 26S proteasome non-ATPase regulatory subunit 10 [Babesia sp. Xinjiang]ORM41137.1 26S proteasome non-ATPase regulatory subunit 10 [Babesia sp. Xinjiang]